MDSSNLTVLYFKAPKECYPRYNYTLEHAKGLRKRYQNILKSLKLRDNIPVAKFDEVHIFILTEKDSDLPLSSQVYSVRSEKVSCNQVTLNDYNTSFENEKRYGSAIFVANIKQDQYFADVLKIMGSPKIIISSMKNPQFQASGNDVISTSSMNKIEENICVLLERAVLRTLFERVRVLQCLLQLEDASVVFSETQIMSETASELSLRNDDIKVKDKCEINSSETFSCSQVWLKARRNAMKNRVMAQYKNSSTEFQDMLLETLIGSAMSTKEFPSEQMYEGVLTLSGKVLEKDRKESADLVRETIDEYKTIHYLIGQVTQIQDRYKEHVLLVRKFKDDLEELHGEIQGMYYRSKVPSEDKPPITLDLNNDLDDRVVKEILAVNGVTSIGNRYGTLNIFIDKSLDNYAKDSTEQQIQCIMQNENILHYMFQYEQTKWNPFRSVGAQIHFKNELKGTLGGFARLGVKKDLCILLARHLADFATDVYLSNIRIPNTPCFAKVLQPKRPSHRHATYDISIAKIVQQEQDNCQLLFKDDSGKSLPSHLYKFEDLNWLQGLQVHIWGASTSPGVGVIDIVNLHMPAMKLLKIRDKPAEKGTAIKRFAQEGDSGAIVCANDVDGKFVYAIAMLMGCSNFDDLKNDPNKRGEYVVLRLQNGLEQLKVEQQEAILDLC